MSAGPIPVPGGAGCCADHGGSGLTRRGLLRTSAAGVGALVGTKMLGGAFLQAAYGGAPGGNVVVVLSLRGGSDGLSLFVPRGVDHDHLTALRPTLAIPERVLLGADPRFGLHPAFADLMPMWDAGTFGAVHAVGLPAPNRSHFEAMEEVESAAPGSHLRVGWISRLIGLDPAAVPEDAVSFGSALLPTSMAGPAPVLGAEQLADLEIAYLGRRDAARLTSLNTMWATDQTSLGDGVRMAIDATGRLAPVVADAASVVHLDAFPTGPLASVLANASALIRADVGTRMIAVDYGDWDMHAGQGRVDKGWLLEHLTHFSRSMKAFFADLGSAASRVTVVTISEFGRRVEENGDAGTDHGYGNAMMLFGAGVSGGAVHGVWPGLAPEDLQDGDLAMRQDFRGVLWEVMANRFPDIRGRRSELFPGLAAAPVGVMA